MMQPFGIGILGDCLTRSSDIVMVTAWYGNLVESHWPCQAASCAAIGIAAATTTAAATATRSQKVSKQL